MGQLRHAVKGAGSVPAPPVIRRRRFCLSPLSLMTVRGIFIRHRVQKGLPGFLGIAGVTQRFYASGFGRLIGQAAQRVTFMHEIAQRFTGAVKDPMAAFGNADVDRHRPAYAGGFRREMGLHGNLLVCPLAERFNRRYVPARCLFHLVNRNFFRVRAVSCRMGSVQTADSGRFFRRMGMLRFVSSCCLVALMVAATTVPAIESLHAQELELRIGPDGVRPIIRDPREEERRRWEREREIRRDEREMQRAERERWERERFERDRRERERGRRGCDPEEAREIARDMGLRRTRVVLVTPRRIVVEGMSRRGPQQIVFANRRGCPEM